MKKILFLISFTLIACAAFAQPKTIPGFKFTDLSGTPVTNASLDKSKATVFIFFSPDCEHCQAQAKMIQPELDKFANAQFVWITWSEDKNMIREFHKKYLGGAAKPKMFYVQDTDYNIDSFFGETNAPAIYVYGKDGAHLATFREEVKAAEIYSKF